MSSRSYDIAGGVLAAAMILGPSALAPAKGPSEPPGTAHDVNEATTGERDPGPAAPVSDSLAVTPEGEQQ